MPGNVSLEGLRCITVSGFPEIARPEKSPATLSPILDEPGCQRSFTGNVSYYALRAARSGRRSGYSGRCDVYSPGCQIDGNSRFEALDAVVEMDDQPCGTLHDVIHPFSPDDHEIDPADEAARNLDWEAFLTAHSTRHRTAILVLVAGGTMREAGARCGLRDSAALVLKRRIAADLIEFFGEDVIRRLLDGNRPGWESDLRTVRERHSYHVEAAQETARAGHR